MAVGVSVKVAVSCGVNVGVTEAGAVSVERSEGIMVGLSTVGVESVPHNEEACPQAVNTMEAMNRMGRRRFTVDPSRIIPALIKLKCVKNDIL